MRTMQLFFVFLFIALGACEGTEPVTCEWQGETYAVGEGWSVDCNTCSCDENGMGVCTAMACEDNPGCTDGETSYAEGDSWDVDCNTCTCSA